MRLLTDYVWDDPEERALLIAAVLQERVREHVYDGGALGVSNYWSVCGPEGQLYTVHFPCNVVMALKGELGWRGARYADG